MYLLLPVALMMSRLDQGALVQRSIPAGPLVNARGGDAATPASPPLAPAGISASDKGNGKGQTPETTADSTPNMIVVTGHGKNRVAPLEAVNIKSFRAVQKVDSAVIAPVAMGYKNAVPHPLRNGLHNFLSNLHEPVVAVNFLLQHRVGKALDTAARFAINTTVGVVGLFDIAKRKPFHLPYRPNGFADTMGFYGVKPGAYMFLPIIGPTTVRDLAGYILDKAALPMAIGSPFNQTEYTVPTGIISALDKRLAFDSQLRQIHKSASPYFAMRTYYLRTRREEIAALHKASPHDGKPAMEK